MKPGVKKLKRAKKLAREEIDASIKDLAARLNVMRTLLYLLKGDTTSGKTAAALLFVFAADRENVNANCPKLTGIKYKTLANLTGLNREELKKSLDYLQRQGFIVFDSNTDWKPY